MPPAPTPADLQALDARLRSLPAVPWRVHPDVHALFVNQHVVDAISAVFPHQQRARKEWISEGSIVLVEARRKSAQTIVRFGRRLD
eukprot:3103046-Lingulodinium_polyedra.AAC.1